ncbi:Crp/Fnr family transcriptional regulator [Hydrogenophaga sp.]|uniref:Crp/Fnr family transcriptional regulator n=1 Tax=Hydrogenophaga sp. TaxID=1904254 RepID=UPI00286E1E4B|nr:Crp/Fnr family transcriptional regulator [Hydrogenophaga sp.]
MTNPDPRPAQPHRPSSAPGLDVEAFLRRAPVLADLPDEAVRELAVAARVEHFDGAALLNAAGQPLTRLRLVVQGTLEIIARRANGTEVVLGDIGPGGWAAWVGCFSRHQTENDFYSTPGATYIALPTDLVRAIAKRHPALYLGVIGDMGMRVRQLMEWTGDSVLLGPEQRMAKLIHLLARTQGSQGDTGSATVQVTQARLAQLARCSRQSANGLVGALERRGLISAGYGRFDIPDVARLVAFIESELDPP